MAPLTWILCLLLIEVYIYLLNLPRLRAHPHPPIYHLRLSLHLSVSLQLYLLSKLGWAMSLRIVGGTLLQQPNRFTRLQPPAHRSVTLYLPPMLSSEISLVKAWLLQRQMRETAVLM